MSDIYFVLVYVALLGAGIAAPFALTLGYVWVDLSYPQFLSTYLAGVPVALVMGGAAIVGYLLADRGPAPASKLITILTLSMAIWVTLTSTWAVAPADAAWDKWNWAFKTILFSAFIPYSIRSRTRIEAFLSVFAFAVAVHLIPGAIKTLLGGTGYSRAFGIIRSNSGILESSTLATIAVMLIPVLLSLQRHSMLLLPWPRLHRIVYSGYAILCAVAAVGTFARTAIVGFGALAAGGLVRSQHRIAAFILLVIALLGAIYLAPGEWHGRMETIDTYGEDTSALRRILVWKWTIEFAAVHPFGGGFNAFFVDQITLPDGSVAHGVAYHNAFIEVLGEHGWIGLALFVSLCLLTIWNLWRVQRQTLAIKECSWLNDLAGALLVSFFVLVGCANFIGIAFQPLFWYWFAISLCLREQASREGIERARPRASPRDSVAIARGGV